MIAFWDVVRNKALAVGAGQWLHGLPALIADLERDWSVNVGRAYGDSTEAFVAEATLANGGPAVLKLHIPRPGRHAENEITVLRLSADGGVGQPRCQVVDERARVCLAGRTEIMLHPEVQFDALTAKPAAAAGCEDWRTGGGWTLPGRAAATQVADSARARNLAAWPVRRAQSSQFWLVLRQGRPSGRRLWDS